MVWLNGKYVLPLVILFLAIVASCQPKGPSIMESLIQTHYETLNAAYTQQAYFRKNVKAGMTQAETREIAKRTSLQVKQDLSLFRKDGEPSNINIEVKNGTTYEIWEYSCYDKVIVMTFQNGKLIRFTDKPGITVMDIM